MALQQCVVSTGMDARHLWLQRQSGWQEPPRIGRMLGPIGVRLARAAAATPV